MATRRSRFQTDRDGPPRKKRKSGGGKNKQPLEIIAPQATLDGLPDSILLCLMSLLDIRTLVLLSRVCRRFHHLYSDEAIWNSVDLRQQSVGAKLDARRLKHIINVHLPLSVSRVKLSSNVFTTKPPIVTGAVLDFLFERCPNITSLALHKCDLTVVPAHCKLYQTSTLSRLSFVDCKTSHDWLVTVSPSWPALTYLSFEGTAMVRDNDLRYIAESTHGKELRFLGLKGCYRVSKAFLLKACAELLVGLKTLDIRDCASEIQESDGFLKHDKLKHISIQT